MDYLRKKLLIYIERKIKGDFILFLFLKIFVIYLLDREIEIKAQVGREAGRGRGRSRLSAEQGARCRA